MAFDPLHCLGAVFLVGMTRKTDKSNEEPPPGPIKTMFMRTTAGILTASLIGVTGGATGSYVTTQILLARHTIKIEQLEIRQTEDRIQHKDDIRDTNARIRDLERKP